MRMAVCKFQSLSTLFKAEAEASHLVLPRLTHPTCNIGVMKAYMPHCGFEGQ